MKTTRTLELYKGLKDYGTRVRQEQELLTYIYVIMNYKTRKACVSTLQDLIRIELMEKSGSGYKLK